MNKSMEAVAWLCADPARTQVVAAMQFGISQGAISAQKSREDMAISWCATNQSAVELVCTELTYNPAASPRALAHKCGISEAEARMALLGIEAMDARKAAASGHVVANPAADMREKCARIAEAVGGEHGAAVAAAIRSVEV